MQLLVQRPSHDASDAKGCERHNRSFHCQEVRALNLLGASIKNVPSSRRSKTDAVIHTFTRMLCSNFWWWRTNLNAPLKFKPRPFHFLSSFGVNFIFISKFSNHVDNNIYLIPLHYYSYCSDFCTRELRHSARKH